MSAFIMSSASDSWRYSRRATRLRRWPARLARRQLSLPRNCKPSRSNAAESTTRPDADARRGRHATNGGFMIGTIIIGLIAGWLAGMLMRGSGYGIIIDILLGLIGAVIGGWIFGALGIVVVGGIGYLAMATVGAVVLVGITHLLRHG